MFDRHHENLPVPNAAGVRRPFDRTNHILSDCRRPTISSFVISTSSNASSGASRGWQRPSSRTVEIVTPGRVGIA